MHNNESSAARECARAFAAFLFPFCLSRKCEFVSHMEMQRLRGTSFLFFSFFFNVRCRRCGNLSPSRAERDAICLYSSFFYLFFLHFRRRFRPQFVRAHLARTVNSRDKIKERTRERKEDVHALTIAKNSLRTAG